MGLRMGSPMGLPTGSPMGLPMGLPTGPPMDLPMSLPIGLPWVSPRVCPWVHRDRSGAAVCDVSRARMFIVLHFDLSVMATRVIHCGAFVIISGRRFMTPDSSKSIRPKSFLLLLKVNIGDRLIVRIIACN